MMMSAKGILYGSEARHIIIAGINKTADAVKTTLGPGGKVVVFGRQFGGPSVTKDGVTVARQVELEDHFENIGAQLCQEVASKANDNAGDGTTTATVLLQAMVNTGMQYVAAGGNSVRLKKGMEKAVEQVVNYINENSKAVESNDDLKFVAKIAGNSDEIGQYIAEAVDKVGKDGIITIEEAKIMATELEFTEGYSFDRGFESPYFLTFLSTDGKEIVLENANILIIDEKLQDAQALVEWLTVYISDENMRAKPLLFVAESFDKTALATIITNLARGGLANCCMVKLPGFGEKVKEMAVDLAIATGGKVVSSALGFNLSNVKGDWSFFGKAQKIVIKKDETAIISGGGNEKEISDRIQMLKGELTLTDSQYERTKLQERLSKLGGAAAIIRIGAVVESELQEKKQRYEDALCATKAALEKGIVAGGGLTLLRASQQLDSTGITDENEITGFNIVRKALEIPIKIIADNAGQSGEVILSKSKETSGNNGYNAATDSWEDLVKTGIVDAAKVTLNAVQSAASVASMVLVTECLINDLPKKDNTPDMPMMG